MSGHRCTRVAEGGHALQTVEDDRRCFACTLAGKDGRTLDIVANHDGGSGASETPG